MKEISAKELKKKLDSKEDIQIFDVREFYEYEHGNMGAVHIPMGEILTSLIKIDSSKPVVIHCKSGKRAAAVIDSLERIHKLNNLYLLSGGIEAWVKDIDPNIQLI